MATYERVIHVRASRRQVVKILRQLPGAIGGSTDSGGYQQATLVRMGLAALDKIQEAFVTKARGGTDEAGDRWKPLSPYTIAARRHPGVPPKASRAAKRPSFMLSAAERKRWWKLYSRNLSRFKGDKAHAAASAWFVLKQEGARTMLSAYGGMNVEILRDTGLLLNSLKPGAPAESAPSSPPRVPKQVFRIGQRDVKIGTNREWAWTHHQGIPGRIPQRRLWPEPGRWPRSWWQAILEQGREGVIDILTYLLTRGQ